MTVELWISVLLIFFQTCRSQSENVPFYNAVRCIICGSVDVNLNDLLPPLKKEVMFFWFDLFVCLSVCLSVSLSVCPSDYPQTCERILTKFFGGVGHGSRTK